MFMSQKNERGRVELQCESSLHFFCFQGRPGPKGDPGDPGQAGMRVSAVFHAFYK